MNQQPASGSSPDEAKAQLLEDISRLGPGESPRFTAFRASQVAFSPRQRMECWIGAAEALRQIGRPLPSVQCYVELVAVSPLDAIGNIAWTWIRASLEEERWEEMNNRGEDWPLFEGEGIPDLAASLAREGFPRGRRPTDTAEIVDSIIATCRKLFGGPGGAPFPGVRMVTARSRAEELLAVAGGDPSSTARAAAKDAMRGRCDLAAIEALTKALDQPDVKFRRLAAELFRAVGKAHWGRFSPAMFGVGPKYRRAVATREAAVVALTAALHDADSDVRASAALALRGIQTS